MDFIFRINIKKTFLAIKMPEKQKVYCGMKQVLPQGYDRFAIPYQCLKKGFGACLYANKLGIGHQQQFFSKLSNRLVFLLVLMVMFAVLLFLLNKFFTET
jgi:hypothetical protein